MARTLLYQRILDVCSSFAAPFVVDAPSGVTAPSIIDAPSVCRRCAFCRCAPTVVVAAPTDALAVASIEETNIINI
ncbi:predicted protein [Arabidopsis lyrata subsp. lyrata]|uniref:Predicted protein n=1 Tax=Arabidopsis lyrata subsp. lyrata TaxID=81972 RepID=D7LLV2_ARALL|nr:predicted protein [Arabidopsis lyrata subsp. lyrata]